MFALGFISGILISLLLAILWVGRLNGLGPKQSLKAAATSEFVSKKKGAIYEAPTDIEIARQEIIEKNRQEGRETKVSELID